MLSLPEGKSLILFDGDCLLCNRSIQYVLRKDKSKSFLFAPLQTQKVQQLLQSLNIKIKDNIPNSVILIEDEKVYQESTAVLKIIARLSGAVKYLSVFRIVPKFIRNPIYRFIAQRRYRWFGKTEQCLLPTLYADRFW